MPVDTAAVVAALQAERDRSRQQQLAAGWTRPSVYEWEAGYQKGLTYAIDLLLQAAVIDLRDQHPARRP